METRSNHILVGGVVLILLAAIAIGIVWLSRIGEGDQKLYDIYFKQSVSGLAKGSNVSFSGVPSGQVTEIALWQRDPSFVRVRIAVNPDTPVLVGTTASINGVGFTGVSEIQLDGAVKGAPPISCPPRHPETQCPDGVPVIPPRAGGLGELLNNAPQLLERLTTLTERLTELLSDQNQASIAGILKNTQRLTATLADQGPNIQATMEQTRIAIKQAGDAAEQIGQLAGTTNQLLDREGRPLMQDLRKTIQSAQQSMDDLDATIKTAQPGVATFSNQTMPEVQRLVRDLRQMTKALSDVAEKVDRQGAGSIVGSPALPDYEGQ